MKKLLFLLAAILTAFSGFAQDETETPQPIFYGTPSNMVLTIQAMDAATEYGNEPAEVNYYLQPIDGRAGIYTSNGFEINLKGYTDPDKGKSAKYIYSIKYYKYGYGQEAPEGENNNPIFNNENSYTVFIGENDNVISLSVCASWPTGKNYVEWIHNFSNIVATDANVYAYLYISGNELPKTFTYINKFASQTGVLDGSNFNKYYTKANTNAANISTSFMKGDSQSGLVYLSDNTFNNDKEDGVYKVTLDYATGELTTARVTNEFDVYIDGFTTLVAPFDFDLTDNVKAYTLSYNSEDQCLDAIPVQGTNVKAYTPVVLAASKIADYTFSITSEIAPFTPTLVEGQAKKGTLADTHMEGNVLVGVNHPHWLDIYNGNNEKNYRYVLSGKQFVINKAFDTKKQYDNPIIAQYTCYVELPSELEVVPQSLEIVFPEVPVEPAEFIYVHFTDEDGNYDSTHWGTLTFDEENGIYSATLDFGLNTCFVLADANFPEEAETYSIMAVNEASSWADLDEDANIYSLDPEDLSETPSKAVITKAAKVTSLKPFTVQPGKIIDLTLALANGEPEVTAEVSEVGGGLSGIVNISVDVELPADNRIFNVFGQQVDETYKGIVIKNGKKVILR